MIRRDHYTKRQVETNRLESLREALKAATVEYAEHFGLDPEQVNPLQTVAATFRPVPISRDNEEVAGFGVIVEEPVKDGVCFFLVFAQENDAGDTTPVKLPINDNGEVRWENRVTDSIYLSRMPYLTLNLLAQEGEVFGEMDLYEKGDFIGVYSYKSVEGGVLTQSLDLNSLENAFVVLDRFNKSMESMKLESANHNE